MTKIGIVTSIDTFDCGDKKMMIIEVEGKQEMFFSDLKGYNKSLKVGDKCTVYFKMCFDGLQSYKATKTK